MIEWYSNLTKGLVGEGNSNVMGRHDRMSYLGEEAVLQSVGLMRRDSRVAATADFLAATRDALKERGIHQTPQRFTRSTCPVSR
jgi:hypothetical protein